MSITTTFVIEISHNGRWHYLGTFSMRRDADVVDRLELQPTELPDDCSPVTRWMHATGKPDYRFFGAVKLDAFRAFARWQWEHPPSWLDTRPGFVVVVADWARQALIERAVWLFDLPDFLASWPHDDSSKNAGQNLGDDVRLLCWLHY